MRKPETPSRLPEPRCVLTIAGSDSGGGAGIQADLKTITVLGGFGMSAITALTAQNTREVQAIQTVSPDFVLRQIEAVATDLPIHAAKTGMLANREIVEHIIDFLEIAHIRKSIAGTLSYGLRKRVELARAVALEPASARSRDLLARALHERAPEAVPPPARCSREDRIRERFEPVPDPPLKSIASVLARLMMDSIVSSTELMKHALACCGVSFTPRLNQTGLLKAIF